MKKLFFLLLTLLNLVLCAQTREIDSLKNVLANTSVDTVKLQILSDLHWINLMSDAELSKAYAWKELALAKKVKHARFTAQAYSDLGAAYVRQGIADSALQMQNKALEIRRSMGDKNLVAASLSNIAVTYYSLGKHDEALKMQFEAIKTYEVLQNTNSQARILNNISAMYQRLNDPAKAITYLDKAIAIYEKKEDTAAASAAFFNKGNCLMELKQFGKARNFFLKALSYNKRSGDIQTQSYVFTALGVLEKQSGRLQEALEYFRKAYAQSIDGQNKLDVVLNRQQLIAILIDLKKYTEAEKLALENEAAIDPQIKPRRLENYKQLAMIYALVNKGELARTYLEKFSALKDTLYSSGVAEEVANAEKKYESQKKENENRALQQQNAIKTLEIENNEEKIKVRNQTIFILAAVILVVLVVVLWQISLARIKKQKRALETEKKLQQDRERISRDLHDSVGGQLSYVLFSLEGNEESTPEKRKARAADLAAAVRNVTGNLRETIWALNREDLTLKDISDRLKLYARNIFSYTETKLLFEENIVKDSKLNPSVALNLYRICQEALNNCFKHANASEVKIYLSDQERVLISVSDNGVGFVADADRDETYGLSNLKSRASEMGADLRIESSPQGGTSISVIV